MLFNSLEFAIFLPIVFFLYWFATNKNLRNQNLLIVAASLLFYGWWDWRFLLLMVVTITLSYLSGLTIRQVRNNREEHSARRGARLVTALNIILNLAIWAPSSTTTSSSTAQTCLLLFGRTVAPHPAGDPAGGHQLLHLQALSKPSCLPPASSAST